MLARFAGLTSLTLKTSGGKKPSALISNLSPWPLNLDVGQPLSSS